MRLDLRKNNACMETEDRSPLWVYISTHEKFSKLDPEDIAQLILIVAKQLEESYGPTIHTWSLRNEAEHAFRVHRDLVRHSLKEN